MSRSVRPQIKSPPDRRDSVDRPKLHDLKRRVARDRRLRRDVPLVPPAALPIVAKHDGHSASADDIRAILTRLPAGVTSGIPAIELCAGDDAIEMFSGVRGPRTLGWYSLSSARIQLFAYSVAPDRKDRVLVDFVLRLRTLATLVHEVAHHDDDSFRGGRRQWRTFAVSAREDYANAMEHEWTRDIVVPYLEETYPEACAALAAWVEERVGIVFPFASLMWNANSLADQLFGPSAIVERLFDEDVPRVRCALDLHLSGRTDDAHRVLDKVLAENPHAPDALAVRARVLRDQNVSA